MEAVGVPMSTLTLFITCVLVWSCTHVLGQNIVWPSNDLQVLQDLWKAWSATPNLRVNLAGWHLTFNNNSDFPCYNPQEDWQGVSCIRFPVNTTTTDLQAYVINLILDNNSLIGTLPPAIGYFTYFVSLQLTSNPGLVGPIPKELGNLPLDWLYLNDNNLNGTIPENLTLPSLVHLNLSGNQLSGAYPMQFSSIKSLQDLVISRNKFSGEIPRDAFVNFTQVQYMDISSNNFQGPLPNMSMMRSLTSLNFSNTGLTGSDLFNRILLPKALITLDLSNTSIVGSSLNWSFLQKQSQLEDLYLDNNYINGALDIKSLWTLQLVPRKSHVGGPNLKVLSLRNNNITGVVADSNEITDVTTMFYLQGNPYCNTKSEDDSTRCYCKQICQITQTSHGNEVTIIATTSCITALIFSIGIFTLIFLLQRSKNDLREIIKKFDEADVNPRRFDYNELRIATKNFDEDMKLGAGAYGAVYKGILSNNIIVAVKRLFMKTQQASSDFTNEVVLITNLRHQNLINLKGFCLRGKETLLVYEYVDNYDLDKILFGSKSQKGGQVLDWPMRYKICLGVAHGLYYLHASTRPKIIHRDIKASNILLDKEFNPKIADFGLARPTHGEDSEILTEQIAGTKGYLAPEYVYYGQLSDKTDVYSFGVLLMEVISGRRNLDNTLPEEDFYLPHQAWKLHSQDKLMDLLDPNLLPLKEADEVEVLRVIKTALSCIQLNVARRPTMFTVVSMLVGDLEIPTLSDKAHDYTSNHPFRVDEISESSYPSFSSLLPSKGGANEASTVELAYHNSKWPNTR